jgi:glutathione S-transferase
MPRNVRPRFITLPLSHYCEKARWALDLAGIDYREERHLPLIHRWHTKRLGGTTVPILVTQGEVLIDSSAIVRFIAHELPETGLLPMRSADRQEAVEMERYFDRELGPHTRRWAYFQLLDCAGLLNRLSASGVPRAERLLVSPLMGVARTLIRQRYRVDAAGADRSLSQVRGVFEQVEQRLGDGRKYLVGDALSVADITFSALAAPVLLPALYGGAAITEADVPSAMAAECRRLRASAAGQYGLAIYERDRPVRKIPTPESTLQKSRWSK